MLSSPKLNEDKKTTIRRLIGEAYENNEKVNDEKIAALKKVLTPTKNPFYDNRKYLRSIIKDELVNAGHKSDRNLIIKGILLYDTTTSKNKQ